MKSQEYGRSLVEMLAVVGIMSIIGMGAVATVRYAIVGGAALGVQTSVENAVQGIQELCSWDPNYNNCNLTQQVAIDNDIVKEGGNMTVATTENAFTVTVTGVSKRACRRLINPAYTTWAPGLVKFINAHGSDGRRAVSSLNSSYWRSDAYPCPGDTNTMVFESN